MRAFLDNNTFSEDLREWIRELRSIFTEVRRSRSIHVFVQSRQNEEVVSLRPRRPLKPSVLDAKSPANAPLELFQGRSLSTDRDRSYRCVLLWLSTAETKADVELGVDFSKAHLLRALVTVLLSDSIDSVIDHVTRLCDVCLNAISCHLYRIRKQDSQSLASRQKTE